jgi:hypothetical protein
MGMGQYLLIPFLVGWTSIYQLFWGSLGTRVLTHTHMYIYILIYRKTKNNCYKTNLVGYSIGYISSVWYVDVWKMGYSK